VALGTNFNLQLLAGGTGGKGFPANTADLGFGIPGMNLFLQWTHLLSQSFLGKSFPAQRRKALSSHSL
jgi:hypothetical protein